MLLYAKCLQDTHFSNFKLDDMPMISTLSWFDGLQYSVLLCILTVQVVCPEILYSPAAQGTGVLDGFKQECPASQALQVTAPVSLAYEP